MFKSLDIQKEQGRSESRRSASSHLDRLGRLRGPEGPSQQAVNQSNIGIASGRLSLVFSPRTAARPLWPGCPLNEHRGYVMLIKKHDSSDIVELEDGSLWRIWPGDIALTLNWLPTTNLLVSELGDVFCSHALIDQTDDSRVRVIEASENWPVEHVRRSMKEG